MPLDQLPDLLAREDLVDEIARVEGWGDFERRRWNELRDEIKGYGTKHLDLVYGGRDEHPVIAVAAYHSSVVSWLCAGVNPSLRCPILHAIADVKLQLDEARKG